MCNWKIYSYASSANIKHGLCKYATLQNLDHDFVHVHSSLHITQSQISYRKRNA